MSVGNPVAVALFHALTAGPGSVYSSQETGRRLDGQYHSALRVCVEISSQIFRVHAGWMGAENVKFFCTSPKHAPQQQAVLMIVSRVMVRK